jgi:hypothetical protein
VDPLYGGGRFRRPEASTQRHDVRRLPLIRLACEHRTLGQNQPGALVAHAVRKETDAVICRFGFRLA